MDQHGQASGAYPKILSFLSTWDQNTLIFCLLTDKTNSFFFLSHLLNSLQFKFNISLERMPWLKSTLLFPAITIWGCSGEAMALTIETLGLIHNSRPPLMTPSKVSWRVYPFLIMFCHNRKIEAGCSWEPVPYIVRGKVFPEDIGKISRLVLRLANDPVVPCFPPRTPDKLPKNRRALWIWGYPWLLPKKPFKC